MQRSVGGWKTFAFVTGGMVGISITEKGVTANLVVYLMQQYNMKSIEATQITIFINGCIFILPVFGAILADATFGCFNVAVLGSAACLMGMFLLTLTSTIASLRPPPCFLNPCHDPTTAQLLMLYFAITLICIGIGGTKYNLATFGANQLEDPAQQATFFNWYFALGIYISAMIGQVAIVYVEDNVGWQWGYGLCGILVVASFIVLFTGKRYYRLDKPQKMNPFLSLFSIVVSTLLWKKKLDISDDHQGQYYKLENGESSPLASSNECHSLEAQNEAKSNGSKINNIKDFTVILHVLPIAASALPVSASIALVMSFSLLQALAMDRHITSHFILPAGSITVVILFSVSISLVLLDRVIYPSWRYIVGQSPSPPKRIGMANALLIATVVCAALIEKMRLSTLQTTREDTKASVLWLFPPLIMMGVIEALHVPGLVSLYHREFPETLRGMATGMFALTTGAGYYISIGVVKALRTFTTWLEDDVDDSRIDKIYGVLATILFINLVYFIVCARLYNPWNVL